MSAKAGRLNLWVVLILVLSIVCLPGSAQTSASIPSTLLSQNDGPALQPLLPSTTSDKTSGWEQLPPEIRAKVDPRIWQELSGEIIPAHLGGQPDSAQIALSKRQPLDKTRFLVYLKAQADLKTVTAQPFATLAQRRTAVADALINTAQATQGPVKSLLDMHVTAGAVAAYQPFYIFNGFAVEGNWDTVVELAKRDDVERIAANYPLIKYDQLLYRTSDLKGQSWYTPR